MKILGINGLGVLPSACVVVNGKIISFAEEERFTRLKGSFGMMPIKSAKFCLDFAGLNINEIDSISFGWDCPQYRLRMPLFLIGKYISRSPKKQDSSNVAVFVSELIKYHPQIVKSEIREMLIDLGLSKKRPDIKFIPHHLSHAASAYYVSGFDHSYILVIDGSGENSCTSIYTGTGQEIKLVDKISIPDSLGWFFQSVTEFLGFAPNNHEGKLMGLAAYGKPDTTIDAKMNQIVAYNQGFNYRYNAEYGFLGEHTKGKVFSEQFELMFGEPRKNNDVVTDYHKNIAFAAQKKLEEVVVGIVKHIARQKDFNGNLCIAGGVALNCKMNGAIMELPEIKNLYIPSVPGDAGVSLGSALVLAKQKSHQVLQNIEHAYWGTEYSDSEIEDLLIKFRLRYKKCDTIESDLAGLLAQGKIAGWFQGRMESGSRALGARSILASPIHAAMKDYINQKVKGRESWRPFAASILYENSEDFVYAKNNAPFMAIAFRVKESAFDKIAAAIHVDYTTRPQFVKKSVNEKYWNLIYKFGEITGVPAILNTSFNTKEEPIVENPMQAIKAFYGSGMDCLAIGNFLLEK